MQYTRDELLLFARFGAMPRPPREGPRRRRRRRERRRREPAVSPARRPLSAPQYLELEFDVSEPVER